MTTKVTVDAHAGWDVLVTTTERYPDRPAFINQVVVQKNTVQDFYITKYRSLLIEELEQ